VRQVFEAAVDTLSEADQRVTQIEAMLPLLLRGVAVHHSGLLPLLKELVEILFQEGLVRFLFATETFSLGLNMPARTVVFTSMRKWDGEVFRPPSAAEYIQMSGRAGRRGLDAQGMVVLLLNEEIEAEALQAMMSASPLPLESAFRLRYNTLLKLYALESYDVELLVRRSFYTYQRVGALPEIARRRAALEAEAAALTQPDEPRLRELLAARSERAGCEVAMEAFVRAPKHVLRFLQPGRLCLLEDASRGVSLGWGVLLGWHGTATSAYVGGASVPPERMRASELVLDVLLPCAAGAQALALAGDAPQPAPLHDPSAEAWVLPVRLSCLQQLSSVRLWLPDEVSSPESRRGVLHALRQVFAERRLADASAARQLNLRPLEHLGDRSPACKRAMGLLDAAVAREAQLDAELRRLPAVVLMDVGGETDSDGASGSNGAEASGAHVDGAGCGGAANGSGGATNGSGAGRPAGGATPATLVEREKRLSRKQLLQQQAAGLATEAAGVACDEFGETVRRMQRVLLRLGLVDSERVVLLKGRAAAEVDASDEVLVAELLYRGFFNELSPAAAAAVCSCLVAADMEKIKRPQTPLPALQPPLATLREVATEVARVYTDAGIATDEAEYVQRFDSGMVNMVHAWCEGATFAELCDSCELFEGSIIRAIRRLSELLDELKSAAKAMGNDELFSKLEESCRLLRRDIVFASSLYVEM